MDGSTEIGTVSANGTNLIFQVSSGTSQIKDSCANRNANTTIKPRMETFIWSIRPNPDKGNITTLCINKETDTAECYEKQ